MKHDRLETATCLNVSPDKNTPQETFYDGYIVNAILDAAYKSAKTKQWEPVEIADWRGLTEIKPRQGYADYDENYYLIKEELLPSGEKKVIVKHKQTGSIEKR